MKSLSTPFLIVGAILLLASGCEKAPTEAAAFNIPPQVSIIYPVEGDTCRGSFSVVLFVRSECGITKLDFELGDELGLVIYRTLTYESAFEPYNGSMLTPSFSLSPGQHTITAEATNCSGMSGESQSVAVVVVE